MNMGLAQMLVIDSNKERQQFRIQTVEQGAKVERGLSRKSIKLTFWTAPY